MDEKELKKLPRCQTCLKGNYPEDAKHDFNTYDHPYDDPSKKKEVKQK